MILQLQYVENHDLEKVHELLDYFFCKLQTATTWDKFLFPKWYHPIFDKNLKFQKELKYIFDKYQESLPYDLFDANKREELYNKFVTSNQIAEICHNRTIDVTDFSNLDENDNLFKIFIKPLPNGKKENILSSFYDSVLTQPNLLSAELNLNNMKNHYEKYSSINNSICALCGLEPLPMPISEGKASYDHYLDKARYSFSVVNPYNLIPIGSICNSYVKGSQNILTDESGERCLAFYPYDIRPSLFFSLKCKEPASAFYGGKWEVSISSCEDNSEILEKINTWNRVFNIINRYEEYISKHFNDWFGALVKKVLKDRITLLELINKRCSEFDEEEHPFVIKTYCGYFPEKMFYEYCKANVDNLKVYEDVMKISNVNPLRKPELD